MEWVTAIVTAIQGLGIFMKALGQVITQIQSWMPTSEEDLQKKIAARQKQEDEMRHSGRPPA